MIFGKIDYLNLLPFHIFLKRSTLTSYSKKTIEFKKGVPSKLNKDLRVRRIDAAVVSSVESFKKRYKKLNFGIVAKDEVKSVLVRKNSISKSDPASASSNLLAKILDIKGEIIIGDRALKAYLNEGRDKFYDLSKEWKGRTNLPFVFGRFSCTKDYQLYKNLSQNFLKQNIKIPNYILKQYADSRGIKGEDIRWYLKFISYKIDKKEQKALKIFSKEARLLKFKRQIA
ncbi:MqnA/MqnD/SBP family protein [Campylobacter sp. RM16187]|uniref:MqnA/MqnD/SBP family protein n=1 Tax=Campylobacter sp. RM16187 TaxID=1660063 RepID=UPI0021B532BF|nr:MqnA/MqnD/SBP family protein [Campylobacter sp. RM16187]QKG30129.1 6-amino-6-deoxyfutalosine synthase [Campylobacter sp. RM16187]